MQSFILDYCHTIDATHVVAHGFVLTCSSKYNGWEKSCVCKKVIKQELLISSGVQWCTRVNVVYTVSTYKLSSFWTYCNCFASIGRTPVSHYINTHDIYILLNLIHSCYGQPFSGIDSMAEDACCISGNLWFLLVRCDGHGAPFG